MRGSWIKAGLTGLFGVVLAVAVSSSAMAAGSGLWKITKDHWSESDEAAWRDFIAGLGAADCWTLDACLKSVANPYRHTDPRGVQFLVDCADTPYVLRAYFAWKNGLPFAWTNGVLPADGVRGDIRYSPYGNRVVSRASVPRTAYGVPAMPILRQLTWTISTAMFRRDARVWDPDMFADTYSPRLDREAIGPGAIVYDVNGHIATVWRVEPNGRIWIFSSHPDHTLSRTFVGREFLRTGPELGSIFQKFRPIRVVGAKRAANGALVGGRIVGTPNSEIPDFSLEQYTGNPPSDPAAWRRAQWVWQDETMDFYTYLRAKMSFGDLEYRPLDEVNAMMMSLCQDLRARQRAVEISLEEGIDRMTPPERLPGNIYGTDGVWELYSTPSRDARLKTAFKELYDSVVQFVKLDLIDAPRLKYDGNDLVGDIRKLYDRKAAACTISYRNSAGRSVTLSLRQITERLFKLSFDPYQCVERRWGATDPAELSTCPDGLLKQRWYEAEQKLRNQIDRTYDVDMGYNISELERGPYGLRTGRGVDQPPEVDVRAYLEAAAHRYSAMADAPEPAATR